MSMFGWFNSREREIRQLNKDSSTIVEMARETYRSDRQQEIATQARAGIAQIGDICAGDPRCMERELARIKTLHREARSRHDQIGLTAHTLVIIHVRAQIVGDECAPARDEIDAYIDQTP